MKHIIFAAFLRVEYAFGNHSEALVAARKASHCEARPPFDVLSQLAYCEIETGDIEQAERVLDQLDRDYARRSKDIRLALRCLLENRRRRFGTALSLSQSVTAKTSIYYKKLRLEALSGELEVSSLKDSVRAAYEREVATLRQELTDVSHDQFIPEETR